MSYNWNWGIFFQTSPDGVHTYLTTLLLGTGWTLDHCARGLVMALAIGSLVGIMRTTPQPVAGAARQAYVELFRNIPLLVQMFLWYLRAARTPADRALGDWLKQTLPDASFYTAVRRARASSPRRASPSRCAPASSRCRAASAYAGLALGPHAAADLSLRAAADGVPHHHAAADQRVDEHHQELVGRADDRARRADRARARRCRR